MAVLHETPFAGSWYPGRRAELEALLDKQARVQEEIDKQDAWTLDSRLEQAMDALRCPPGDMPVSVLSGGERRRVALCRLLLTELDILLLDEPTNHLDAESVGWLEQHLREYKGCVILVTHDRYFLDNVTGWILELDRGRGIPHEGNYSSFLAVQDKRLQQEGSEAAARERTIAREREWISQSPRARQAKSKARINAYAELTGDYTPVHIDEDYARTTPFGTRVAQGLCGLSIADGLKTRSEYRFLPGMSLGWTWDFLLPIKINDSLSGLIVRAPARQY